MPEIAKLGHVALVTPDLDTSTWFWRDVVGLEEVERDGDTVFLRAWGEFEHHTLSLRAGSATDVDHVGWRARRPEDVAAFAEELRGDGVEVTEIAAGSERGQGDAIRFTVPASGHPFEIYYDIEKPLAPEERRSRLKNQTAKSWARGVSPRCIDHVNLWTGDPKPAEAWAQDRLGFGGRERVVLPDGTVVASWMAVTSLSHDVAFMTDILQSGGPRMHHVAYYLDNWQDVLRGMDILREAGVDIDMGPGRHGISQAFFCYVRDPGSGHRLELYSGGYHVYDPDWEPIEWGPEDMTEGMIWWGPAYVPGQAGSFDESTPATGGAGVPSAA